MGYICKNYGKYSERLGDILGKNYGIYLAKSIDYFIGYIQQKEWDILG